MITNIFAYADSICDMFAYPRKCFCTLSDAKPEIVYRIALSGSSWVDFPLGLDPTNDLGCIRSQKFDFIMKYPMTFFK